MFLAARCSLLAACFLLASAGVAWSQSYTIWTTGSSLRSADARLSIDSGIPGAATRVTTSSAGDLQWAYLPLTLPSTVRVSGIQLCWENSGSSYISQIRVVSMDTPTTSAIRADDGTDLNSASSGCHDANLSFGDITVDKSLSVGLRLNFLSAGDYIEIGAVGITVETIAATATPDQPPVKDGPAIGQNHPNPFNPNTTIPYLLHRDGEVSLRVYDARGELVRTLWSGPQAAGEYSMRWDGRDDQGQAVASGAYYYQLEADGHRGSKRMVLLK